MPTKQKINLAKVMASLNTPCPKCGYSIPPQETCTHVELLNNADYFELPSNGAPSVGHYELRPIFMRPQ